MMMIVKNWFLGGIASVIFFSFGIAQESDEKVENVFIIMLDGVRWQEVFTGADSLLVGNDTYVENTEKLRAEYWRENPEDRRTLLMPFLWDAVAERGVMYGNRTEGSKVDVANKWHFSYPGYNEVLCGFADDERINSNDKIANPNKTILEDFNQKDGFKGKVKAFGSWDVFPYIINETRSGVPVNAGFELASGDLTEQEERLNEMQQLTPSPWESVRLDIFTYGYALESLKKEHPRLVFISFGETDDFAHDGEYDSYLESATRNDEMIKKLWEFVQSDEHYKGNTSFVITTDHGRGTEPLDSWKDHGKNKKGEYIDGSEETWLAVFGPNIPVLGEVKSSSQLYQKQIAATVAKMLGETYESEQNIGEVIEFK